MIYITAEGFLSDMYDHDHSVFIEWLGTSTVEWFLFICIFCATAPVFGTPLANSTTVQLTWSSVPPGSVQSYRLTITGGGTQQKATVLAPGTAHVFSNLTAVTEYTVTIAAVDNMDREGVMTTRTVTTAKSGMNEWRVCVVSPVNITLINPVLNTHHSSF